MSAIRYAELKVYWDDIVYGARFRWCERLTLFNITSLNIEHCTINETTLWLNEISHWQSIFTMLGIMYNSDGYQEA